MALWNQGDRDTNLILEEDKFKFNIVKNYVILYCLHCIVWAVKGGDERSYPGSEVRDGGWEEQPHLQGDVAARAQEGLEELSHVEGQEGRRWGDTPRPRYGALAALCWSSCERSPTPKVRETQVRR